MKLGNDTKISIVVPVYNTELELPRCIDSIIKQTYSNLQIILIDDGSTDTSGKICDWYSTQDKRIEVYHTINNGSVIARKFGINISVGEYVGFVDSDDYIESNMFLEMLNNIVESDADFVHFGFIEENDNVRNVISNHYEMVFETKERYKKINFLCNHVFNQIDISPSIWSKLYKAKFIKKCFNNLPDKQQYGEDLLCLCSCILEANRISLSKKALYHYVVRKESLSHLNNREYVLKEVRLWNCILNLLENYECEDTVKENVFNYIKGRILLVVEQITNRKVHIPRYYFTDLELLNGKRIIIFGAGNVGQDYYSQICQYNKCVIVAWVDSKWYNYSFEYSEVVSIEKIKNMVFDLIIIAVANEQVGKEIKKLLMDNEYPAKKIYWKKPGLYY